MNELGKLEEKKRFVFLNTYTDTHRCSHTHTYTHFSEFVKLILLKWSIVCRMVSMVQQKTTRGIVIEKIITHRSRRNRKRTHEKDKAECRERGRIRIHALVTVSR